MTTQVHHTLRNRILAVLLGTALAVAFGAWIFVTLMVAETHCGR
jgi:hypothetical protein